MTAQPLAVCRAGEESITSHSSSSVAPPVCFCIMCKSSKEHLLQATCVCLSMEPIGPYCKPRRPLRGAAAKRGLEGEHGRRQLPQPALHSASKSGSAASGLRCCARAIRSAQAGLREHESAANSSLFEGCSLLRAERLCLDHGLGTRACAGVWGHGVGDGSGVGV